MHDYDLSWKQWMDCETYGPSMRHQRRNIQNLLRGLDYASILDIGGGSGDNLSRIIRMRKVKDLCLADISAKALDRARLLMPEAEIVQLDVQKGSIGRKFDLVLCCDVLEHIPDDEAALKNIRKMAGKYLVVSTLSGRMREAEKNVGHVRNYTPGDLLNKLREAGFKPVKIVKWGFPFYSPLYRNLWDKLPQEINYGKFGLFRKLCASVLYILFMLNSSSKGDYIFILSQIIQENKA